MGLLVLAVGIKNIGEGLWEKSINRISETFLGSANSVQGHSLKINGVKEYLEEY